MHLVVTLYLALISVTFASADLLSMLLSEAQAPATREFMVACRSGHGMDGNFSKCSESHVAQLG